MKAGYLGAASVLGVGLVVGWAWAVTPDAGQSACSGAGSANPGKAAAVSVGGCPMKGSEARAHTIGLRTEKAKQLTTEQKRLAVRVKELHSGVAAARANVANLKAANAPASRQAAAKKQLAAREAKLRKVVAGNRSALHAIGIDCQGECPTARAVTVSTQAGCPMGTKIATDGARCAKTAAIAADGAKCTKAATISTDGAKCSKATHIATDGSKCADCPVKVSGDCEGCPNATKVSTTVKDAPPVQPKN